MDRFFEVSVYRLKLQIWCINFAGQRKRACVRTNKLKANISKCTSYLSYIGQVFDYNGYSCTQKLNLKVGSSRAQLNLGLKLPFMWNSIQFLVKFVFVKVSIPEATPKKSTPTCFGFYQFSIRNCLVSLRKIIHNRSRAQDFISWSTLKRTAQNFHRSKIKGLN